VSPVAGSSTDPEARAESESFLNWLQRSDIFEDQIRSVSFFPPRKPEYVDYQGRYAALLELLELRPYRHQAEALNLVEAGNNLIISTPTASGKSLAYQLPLLDTLAGGGCGLYLAPTKALARDQLERLSGLAELTGTGGLISAYDGDTRPADRPAIRAAAGVVVTNPDMVHHAILPHHRKWSRFLASLEVLVLDELHTYRGVFGVHVANVLRRLLRIARHYGARPRVIAASATIGNPEEHFRNLTGLDAAGVSEDSAPAAEREFIFWAPPLLDPVEGRRRSLNAEAAGLAALFARTGLHSLFFANSRKSAELLRRYATDRLPAQLAERVLSYRAGYTQEDRRIIEEAFRKGEVTVLTATSALELGMDVGNVDAVVLAGWPGSHMALWQRVGRAGRRGRRSLAMLLPAADPLDEYYLEHPELVTEGRVEAATADPFNEVIHPLHLACAAAELPLDPAEELIAPGLTVADIPGVQEQDGRWVHFGRPPHRRLGIRGTGPGRLRLVDGFGEVIGETSAGSAFREVHPGAVYLHQGNAWLVGQLDLEAQQAVLLPHIGDWYTQPLSETDIEVLSAVSSAGFGGVDRVRVTNSVTGYTIRRSWTEAAVDERPLDLPAQSYPTQALRIDCSAVASAVPGELLPSALHALEHVLIGLLPAYVLCERADIGGVSYPAYGPDGLPLIFIYDGVPGGVGYVRKGAEQFSDWLLAARDRLRDCSCAQGCPRCVLSPKCGNGNRYLDRAAALKLADALLGLDW